jgi:hypothetical protein
VSSLSQPSSSNSGSVALSEGPSFCVRRLLIFPLSVRIRSTSSVQVSSMESSNLIDSEGPSWKEMTALNDFKTAICRVPGYCNFFGE